jgi:hypothetical protein
MVLSQGLGIKLAKRIGMKKAKVAIVRKIAVILTASGVPVLPLNVIGQRRLIFLTRFTGPVMSRWDGEARRDDHAFSRNPGSFRPKNAPEQLVPSERSCSGTRRRRRPRKNGRDHPELQPLK